MIENTTPTMRLLESGILPTSFLLCWFREVESCHDRANADALEALNNFAKHNTYDRSRPVAPANDPIERAIASETADMATATAPEEAL
jgi:hypothetical protein